MDISRLIIDLRNRIFIVLQSLLKNPAIKSAAELVKKENIFWNAEVIARADTLYEAIERV